MVANLLKMRRAWMDEWQRVVGGKPKKKIWCHEIA